MITLFYKKKAKQLNDFNVTDNHRQPIIKDENTGWNPFPDLTEDQLKR
jgi:hypothetical protein